jgi:hypothetical protein
MELAQKKFPYPHEVVIKLPQMQGFDKYGTIISDDTLGVFL